MRSCYQSSLELNGYASLRIGIIGCGYWGSKLLRVFNDLRNIEVTHLCDIDSEKRVWISARYPEVQFHTQYQEILHSDCDAVVIATPASTHFKIADQFLEAGKHVFVEKPLALIQEHGQHLVDKANNNDLCLFVGHVFEFDPAITKIREIVSSDLLGDIYYFDSVRLNFGLLRLDVNVIWDLLVHDISILNTVFGEFPKEASAIGSSHVTSNQKALCEFCQGSFVLYSGIRANIKVSWLEPIKERRIKIIGSDASLFFDPSSSGNIELYESKIDIHNFGGKVEFKYWKGERHVIQFSDCEPLVVEAHSFIDSIRQGHPTNSQSAVDTIKVLEATQASLDQNGAWITVDPNFKTCHKSLSVQHKVA